MSTQIIFHGVSCYELVGPLGRVLLDPFLTNNPIADITVDQLEPPDVILASHAASDHMGDAAEVALRTGAPVICGTDTAAMLRESGVPEAQIRRTVWGIRIRVGSLTVHPVYSAHWSQARLADGSTITGTPMAFVVAVEPGLAVYHFGDSAVTQEMELIGALHRPVVGLLGVTQPWALTASGAGEIATGEMNPAEAALAAQLLGVRYAVATHYDDPDHPDVKAFLAEVAERDQTEQRVGLALRPGQSLLIDGDRYEVIGS